MNITLEHFLQQYKEQYIIFNNDILLNRSQASINPQKKYVHNLDYNIYYRPDNPKSLDRVRKYYIFHQLLPLMKEHTPYDWQKNLYQKEIPLTIEQEANLLLNNQLIEYQEKKWKKRWLRDMFSLVHVVSPKIMFKKINEFPDWPIYLKHCVTLTIISHIKYGRYFLGKKIALSDYEINLIKQYGVLNKLEDLQLDMFYEKWLSPINAKNDLNKYLSDHEHLIYEELIDTLK